MNGKVSKLTLLCITAGLVCSLAGPAHARIVHLKDAPCSAAGDGIADDRAALGRAFAEAKPGDTVLVPAGAYRMVLTGGAMAIPAGVTLWGQAGKSKFLLSSNGKGSEYREFLRPGSDVTVEGLTIERDAGFSGILLPVSGDASNITFRNCRLLGAQSRFPNSDCHGFRVGHGTVRNLTLDGLSIEDCCYGLFQPNDATGTLEAVLVEHSRFERNTASDLEFNSPKGVMRDIVVRECFFAKNACRSPSGGFAVGFANVQNGRVESCQIRDYGSEALHVEDRSTDILLTGNTIIGGSTRQPNGVILVVNDSRKVSISGNFIDARPNTNKVHLVLVTAGGRNFPCPTDVSVNGNVLVNGPRTQTWYLQDGSGPAPAANLVVPTAPEVEP